MRNSYIFSMLAFGMASMGNLPRISETDSRPGPHLKGRGRQLRAYSEYVAPKYHGTPRNEPCPCGSLKKYKKCHGGPQEAV